jgi:hypothetical protein
MHHIGQLNEQPLHAALKAHYAQPPAQTEMLVDGYLVDVVRDGVLIEIQTGNFSAIKRKLGQLTKSHPVRLVYPIAVEKWILKQPKPGQAEAVRRKSPKRGRPVDLFAELVSFPQLALAPNFTLELALIQEEEVRRYTGEKRWRRNGWETVAALDPGAGHADLPRAGRLCTLAAPGLAGDLYHRRHRLGLGGTLVAGAKGGLLPARDGGDCTGG